MNWDAISFDWNQVRTFLATAEEGSLSAAARALRQTQPTVSRQVAALEDALGITLFERGPRSLQLTETGLELLEHVKAMADAATRVSLAAHGQSNLLTGVVSITASDTVTTDLLPKAIQGLNKKAPLLTLQLIAANDIRDLMNREADIAIRHVRPEQPDLIAKKIGDTQACLFASQRYLNDNQFEPDDMDWQRAHFIGEHSTSELLKTLTALHLNVKEEQCCYLASNGMTMASMVRNGLGIGILPTHTACLYPDLVALQPKQLAFPFEVWLVTHRELHTSQRIRLVFDHLAEALAPMFKSTNAT